MSAQKKLFVVGESTPNQEDWSPWCDISIVVADSIEEAREVAGESEFALACEIPMDRSYLAICRPGGDPAE